VSRVVVVGAGVAGLSCAVRLLEAGHAVTVVEAAATPGGKAGRRVLDGFAFDTGPSLVTMPWVFRGLLGDRVELVRVEPVTRYRFADGTSVDLSADLPRAIEALEAWSPGAGTDWAGYLGACAQMWRASERFLTGPPPFPPRRPGPGEPPPDPRDALRVKPWLTLAGFARRHVRDPRLRMVVERFATYAGADPRRAPAALALAGYVEHAFGAWHVRGGVFRLVEALAERVGELGGELRFGERAGAVVRRGRRVRGIELAGGARPADHVVWSGDALELQRGLRPGRAERERSLSGFVLLLGVRGPTEGLAHHTIAFPRDYAAEFDDVFVHRRPVREPTVYVSTSSVTDPGEAPPGGENWFVLVNAPSGLGGDAFAGYEEHVLERLAAAGLDARGRVAVEGRRTPLDLERETGAVGGAIYGDAPHGRLATLRRPGPRVLGTAGLWRAGGTAHPGGGLPLVALSGELVAREIGPAR
jgi:phytoene desaturase